MEGVESAEQGLNETAHRLTIRAGDIASSGWGIFSNHALPDADGCNRFTSRTDCVRSCAGTIDQTFDNELAWPNRIAGDTSNPTMRFHAYYPENLCSQVPATIYRIAVSATVYSSPGLDNLPNGVYFEAIDESIGTVIHTDQLARPLIINRNVWTPETSFFWNSGLGRIPKNAICRGDGDDFVWDYQMTAIANDYTNSNDWLAVGCIEVRAYF